MFTLFMFFGTLRANKGTKFVFGSLTVRIFLLALRDWLGSNTIGNIAGWEGIVCGLVLEELDAQASESEYS